MPTVCLRFRFRENGKIAALMEACRAIQQEAIDFAWENKKTALLNDEFRTLNSEVHRSAFIVHSSGFNPPFDQERPLFTLSGTGSGRGRRRRKSPTFGALSSMSASCFSRSRGTEAR